MKARDFFIMKIKFFLIDFILFDFAKLMITNNAFFLLFCIYSEFRADNGPPGMEPDGVIEVTIVYLFDTFKKILKLFFFMI